MFFNIKKIFVLLFVSAIPLSVLAINNTAQQSKTGQDYLNSHFMYIEGGVGYTQYQMKNLGSVPK